MHRTGPADRSMAVSLRRVSTPGGPDHRGLATVDLDVPRGTLTVVEGAPADGALDLLHCLAGENPGSGTVTLFGVEVSALSPSDRRGWLTRHVGAVLDDTPLLGYLTVGENLDLADDDSAGRTLLTRLAGADLADAMPADTSPDQRWLITLARVLSGDHAITVVDVPATEPPDERWMPHLRALVDLYSRTVLVGMRRRDHRLRYDRVVVVRDGEVRVDTRREAHPPATSPNED